MKQTTSRFVLFSFFLFLSFLSVAQVPGIRWQRALGGNNQDAPSEDTAIAFPNKMPIVVNNGYILGTSTFSNNGDVAGNHGSFDIWIVRMDTARNILWQKCYGSNNVEIINELITTTDGGYVAGGIATANGGDVAGTKEQLFGDGWLFKVNSSGTLLWQLCIGGGAKDEIKAIKQTTDKGFIMVANTRSNNFDVSGNHGDQDIWLVKVDSMGTAIEWSKCLGGSGLDIAGDIILTSDGGYIVTGATESNNGDVSGNHGTRDMWVVKLDANGNIIWQKCYGGTDVDMGGSITETVDGGYFIAGQTFSNDGDVTGLRGQIDAWLVKISATGDLAWQKCYGGSNWDGAIDGQRTADGGFIVAGYAASANGDVTGKKAGQDAWLLKVNSNGDLQWQKCLGGNGNEIGFRALPTGDNEYIFAGSTTSTNGDVSGQHGNSDLWLVQLGSTNTIKGTVYYDMNSNAVFDAGDKPANEVSVKSVKTGQEISAIPNAGKFLIETDLGNYTTTVTPFKPYYTVVPPSASSTFSTYFNIDSFGFALQPIPGINDLVVTLLTLQTARAGFTCDYRVIYQNAGTEVIPNGTIQMVKDSRTNFVSASIPPSSITGDTLRWDYTNLEPADTASILIRLQILAPPVLNFGDIIRHVATIGPIAGDLTPGNDTSRVLQVVRNSFDPNDKIENNNGLITEEQLSGGEYLHYTIRFQNTGNDTAFNVVIRDTLDARLDWSTLELVAASHPFQFNIANGNQCTWTFDNILLPDSITNEPRSHGYIMYRIQPDDTLSVGDTIYNDASIYFDYNLPVITNIQETAVGVLTPLPVGLLAFDARLNNNNTVSISWQTAWEENSDHFDVEKAVGNGSFKLLQKAMARNAVDGSEYSVSDNNPSEGTNYYRLKIVDKDGSFTYSKTAQVRLDGAGLQVDATPNPAQGSLNIRLQGTISGTLDISIYDMTGKRLIQQSFGNISGNNYLVPVNLSTLQRGVYLAKIRIGNLAKHYKFVVQ